jgi:hypothetical protein
VKFESIKGYWGDDEPMNYRSLNKIHRDKMKARVLIFDKHRL